MEKLTVQILRLKEDKDLPLPRRMTMDASGLDLYAAVKNRIHIPPGEREIIPTGIQIAVPFGYEAQVRPRSGLALHSGVTVLNSPGTIDADYRGEVKVILINHGSLPFEINRGDRIAQMVIRKTLPVELVEVEELSPTERDDGGFGHTGKSVNCRKGKI